MVIVQSKAPLQLEIIVKMMNLLDRTTYPRLAIIKAILISGTDESRR